MLFKNMKFTIYEYNLKKSIKLFVVEIVELSVIHGHISLKGYSSQ